VFWKILELAARIIYARRIRHATWVGDAAKLAGEGDFDGALDKLADMEKKLHPRVRSLHALTRGRILDQIGRTKEAEHEILRAAKLDPSNMRAHLDLAMMCGRRFLFDNARSRLLKLAEEAEPEIREEAKRHLALMDRIASGSMAKELKKRALSMARHPMGPDGETPGLPADLAIVDEWISASGDAAREHADDIALLLGETWVCQGGRWRISLSLKHSLVVLRNGNEISPFQTVKKRLTEPDTTIARCVEYFER